MPSTYNAIFLSNADGTLNEYGNNAGSGGGGSSDSSEDIEAIVNVYGAKNLLPYPYNNTTKTENGITFTDNGDGTITASGTATSNAIFYMSTDADNRFKMKKGSYIASGCPQNNGDFNIDVYVENTDYLDTGSGVEITIQNEESVAMVVITILSGTDLTTPITFKPMIRDARISDDTFVPYAMTNKELMDEVNSNNKVEHIPNTFFTNTVSDFVVYNLYRYGKLIIFTVGGTISGNYGTLAKIPTDLAFLSTFPVNAYYQDNGYEVPTYASIRPLASSLADVYVVNKNASNKFTVVGGIILLP